MFLDCDGVIFDSNGFKLDALRYSLVGFPAPALREMEAYWSANGGVSRYEKLGYFFSEILHTSEVSKQVAAAALRFTEFSRRAYGDCSPVPEALLFARSTGAERCFVVSGTDQDELRDVFAAKELSRDFAQVCGSPTSKHTHMKRILEEHSCPGERALFIGDGGGDFDVARRLGVPFIYIDQYSEWRSAKATLNGVTDVLVCETWNDVLTQLGVQRAE
ncbi:MAG: HAD family hydrolase [Pseudomonadota bacterium]